MKRKEIDLHRDITIYLKLLNKNKFFQIKNCVSIIDYYNKIKKLQRIICLYLGLISLIMNIVKIFFKI